MIHLHLDTVNSRLIISIFVDSGFIDPSSDEILFLENH